MAGIFSNKSILIVDDDARMLKALEKVLSHEGASVIGVELASDAFRVLAARPLGFNLVITDLWLPLMSGVRTLEIIHELFPKLPVIILTAYGGPDVEEECVRKGAAAYLEKPLDTSRLLEVLGKIFTGTEVSQNGNDKLPDWQK